MKNLTLVLAIFITINCFAQPGDMSSYMVRPRVYGPMVSSLEVIPNPVILYDGLNLNSEYLLKTIDPNSINSIKISKDSVFDAEHVFKYLGIIEIATKDEVNPGLKYINTSTGDWTKNYPLTVYYLNGKVLSDDTEKLNELQNIKVSSVKQIRTLDYSQGKELLREAGKNGVIIIDTN